MSFNYCHALPGVGCDMTSVRATFKFQPPCGRRLNSLFILSPSSQLFRALRLEAVEPMERLLQNVPSSIRLEGLGQKQNEQELLRLLDLRIRQHAYRGINLIDGPFVGEKFIPQRPIPNVKSSKPTPCRSRKNAVRSAHHMVRQNLNI